MLITLDTTKDDAATARVVIGFLANLYNLEPSEVEVPEGTTPPKGVAPAAVIAAGAVVATAAAGATLPSAQTVLALPPPSNVLNLPVPPPPTNVAAAVTSAAIADVAAPNSVVVMHAAAAPSAAFVPAEYDSAGMPWDARIHQKAKGKKKDLTWKLIKGIDEAVVLAVTIELASRKIATTASPSLPPTPAPAPSVPPPPTAGTVAILGQNGNVVATGAVPPPPATVAPQVSLPDTVPVPPVPSTAPVETVSVPTAPAAGVVPVPPVAPAGVVGGVSYRSLIDKMTAGTKAQTLTAAKVLQIVQDCGCPNLQQLNQMSAIWPDVDARLELALAGL